MLVLRCPAQAQRSGRGLKALFVRCVAYSMPDFGKCAPAVNDLVPNIKEVRLQLPI